MDDDERSLLHTTMVSTKIRRHKQRLTETYKCFAPFTTPRVLVLFCGGTMIMQENKDGSLVVSDKNEALELLLGFEPKLREIVQLDVHYVDNLDSTNMTPEHWDTLAGLIHEKYEDHDGFVITHGTDTMAYTASALSFVLGDLGKPVIITGAQIPGGRIESDARRNFVNAVRVSTLSKAGVFLVFDDDIILGARAHKISESKLAAFSPINWGLHGEIRIDIRFHDGVKDRHDRPLDFSPGFETNIAMFTLFPGFPVDHLESAVKDGVKGIILEGVSTLLRFSLGALIGC
jgi:L-asparaginase